MRDDTTARDRRLDQAVQLLVSSDGQLQVPGSDTLHLQVLGRVSGQLQDLQEREKKVVNRNTFEFPATTQNVNKSAGNALWVINFPAHSVSRLVALASNGAPQAGFCPSGTLYQRIKWAIGHSPQLSGTRGWQPSRRQRWLPHGHGLWCGSSGDGGYVRRGTTRERGGGKCSFHLVNTPSDVNLGAKMKGGPGKVEPLVTG